MKFMGSKRAMLQNGLGELIRVHAASKERVVDLFSGSASVSWFAAEGLGKAVLAVDLQHFAATLARSVIARTAPLKARELESRWIAPVQDRLMGMPSWISGSELDASRPNAGSWAKRARELCASSAGSGPIWRAYGGYYFSPSQAVIRPASTEPSQ